MYISGFQKVSLVDYPGLITAIVFTRGCNFRCPWCHNPELVNPEMYETLIEPEAILTFLKTRIGKLDAVTITGGEPTLHADLPQLINEIRKLGFKIKLDTNGTNPDMLTHLIHKNLLDYIAMDVKAPLTKYDFITQTSVSVTAVRKSIHIIQNSGVDHEFRTTYIPQLLNEQDIDDIRIMLGCTDNYFVQPFHCEKLLDDSLKFSSEIAQDLWFKMKEQVSGVIFRD